jgi:glycosyltransferase involved in cell wall biosynthesis
MDLDAFVIVRHLAALAVPVRTRGVFYWSHDNLQQPFLHGMYRFFIDREKGDPAAVCCLHLGEVMEHVDAVFAVSRWQAGSIADRLGVDPGRIEVVGNGLQPGLFSPEVDWKAKRPIILYSLPPDRGMLPLLEIFAKASPHLDGAQLHLYSRSTIYGTSDEEDYRMHGDLYRLTQRIPGVTHFEPVNQRVLAAAMQRAMVYAYPTSTEETFCISILEAQAAGAIPISSACGAIPERITPGVDGFLVTGDPLDEAYQRTFVDKLVRLLRDADLRRRMAEAARAKAHSLEYTYEAVAGRMLSRIERVIANRPVETRVLDVGSVPTPYVTPRTAPNAAPGRPLDTEQLLALQGEFERLLELV